MKYTQRAGKEFVFNKHSRLRVRTVQRIESPKSPGRICRILFVNEVLKRVDSNPIEEGQMIALSFPSDKANVKTYTWTAGEECQVPFQIKLMQ